MKSLSSWNALLAAPAPRDHLVQLYTREHSLAATVARFVEHGLADGDGVIAIATAPHWTDVASRLTVRGLDVGDAQRRSQLMVLDAHETLGRLMVDGMPDGAAMHGVITPALEAVRGAGYAKIRAFGEMVDILNRRGNLAAAIRLEELWNELLEVEGIALLCAYAIDPFDRAGYAEALPSIGHVHSHLMPVEDSERLERAIDRAFVDVFGIYGDTRLLRDLFVRKLPDTTAMPTAQGALFALRDLDPRLADAVLERAASYYRSD
jgi:MEDS: MEthanogen/methylotroph, DcmR Sensory domain